MIKAPPWRSIPGLVDLMAGREFSQDDLDWMWDYATDALCDPLACLAILRAEGTGSFNTSSDNLAADGQNGVDPNWRRDTIKAVDLLTGKLALYLQAEAQGWGKLAVQVVSPGAGVPQRADGSPYQWLNWKSAILRFGGDVEEGAYAGHASWWINVQAFHREFGGSVADLYKSAAALDQYAPRVQMTFALVTDNIPLGSNWNATAPEPVVVVTSTQVLSQPEQRRVKIRKPSGEFDFGVWHLGRTWITLGGITAPLRDVAEALEYGVEWIGPEAGGPMVKLHPPVEKPDAA